MRSAPLRIGAPIATSLVAVALRALTLLVLVELAGPVALRGAFDDVAPWWIALVAGAEVATLPSYALIYRTVASLDPPIRLAWRSAALMVLSGFGPLAVSGGFGADRRALQALEGDEVGARRRVSTVTAIESAVLAVVTAGASLAVLVSGEPVSRTLTYPWVVGVGAGIAAAAWATAPKRMAWLSHRAARWSASLVRHLVGVGELRSMVRHPRPCAMAWVGAVLYWFAEVSAFWAALRASGLHLGVTVAVLAYANGYLASRRSLPLGGAGIAEALLVISLHQMHVTLSRAVAAVIIYRTFNFVAGIIPALVADELLQRTADPITLGPPPGRHRRSQR